MTDASNEAALPAPDAGAVEARSFVPARNELEEALCRIWDDVLQVGQVGIEDDFFALGGHSLLATQVMFRIQTELGVAVPLVAIFRSPTVAGLAQEVEQARQDAEEPAAPERPPASPDGLRAKPPAN